MLLFRSKVPARSSSLKAGHTLTETMIASALSLVVVTTIVICNIGGLKFAEYVQPKIENSQYARQTIARMIEEIRCANSVQVGTGNTATFTNVGAARPQVGNAIRIYPGTNTAQYIYYFLDTNEGTIKQIPLGATIPRKVATCVTNLTPFSYENYAGTTLTNPANNAVLSIQLQMRRASEVQGVGDAYQVRSRVTRRNIL